MYWLEAMRVFVIEAISCFLLCRRLDLEDSWYGEEEEEEASSVATAHRDKQLSRQIVPPEISLPHPSQWEHPPILPSSPKPSTGCWSQIICNKKYLSMGAIAFDTLNHFLIPWIIMREFSKYSTEQHWVWSRYNCENWEIKLFPSGGCRL